MDARAAALGVQRCSGLSSGLQSAHAQRMPLAPHCTAAPHPRCRRRRYPPHLPALLLPLLCPPTCRPSFDYSMCTAPQVKVRPPPECEATPTLPVCFPPFEPIFLPFFDEVRMCLRVCVPVGTAYRA